MLTLRPTCSHHCYWLACTPIIVYRHLEWAIMTWLLQLLSQIKGSATFSSKPGAACVWTRAHAMVQNHNGKSFSAVSTCSTESNDGQQCMWHDMHTLCALIELAVISATAIAQLSNIMLVTRVCICRINTWADQQSTTSYWCWARINVADVQRTHNSALYPWSTHLCYRPDSIVLLCVTHHLL